MATPVRSARGTFATELPRDRRTVVEIIRQLVLLSADRYDKDPTQVTLAEADGCADQLIGYGRIPKIRGLLAQIPDRHGKPYPYRTLLRDLFDPERSFEHVQRERVTVEDWPDLDQGHIDYALNRVADFAQVTSFPPSTYDVHREELIRDERRRRRDGVELARRIPTSDQIIRVHLGADGSAAATTTTDGVEGVTNAVTNRVTNAVTLAEQLSPPLWQVAERRVQLLVLSSPYNVLVIRNHRATLAHPLGERSRSPWSLPHL